MVYTVTLNPSLDYIVTVPDFTMGATNRTLEEHVLPGGKGINVKLKNYEGTEINGMGPEVSAREWEPVFRETKQAFSGGYTGSGRQHPRFAF